MRGSVASLRSRQSWITSAMPSSRTRSCVRVRRTRRYVAGTPRISADCQGLSSSGLCGSATLLVGRSSSHRRNRDLRRSAWKPRTGPAPYPTPSGDHSSARQLPLLIAGKLGTHTLSPTPWSPLGIRSACEGAAGPAGGSPLCGESGESQQRPRGGPAAWPNLLKFPTGLFVFAICGTAHSLQTVPPLLRSALDRSKRAYAQSAMTCLMRRTASNHASGRWPTILILVSNQATGPVAIKPPRRHMPWLPLVRPLEYARVDRL